MSMAYVAIAVSVIAAGTSAYASYESGQSQKKAMNYNAEMQKRAADDALQRGATEAAEHRTKTRQIIARQNAAFSAGGVDTSTGTPLEIMTETSGNGELDALRIVNNSERSAWGYNANAELDLFKGQGAARAGTLNATGSLLGGLASAAGQYANLNKNSK